MSTPPLARFEQYLRASDKSENTVEAYLRDLRLFGEWFQSSNREHMTPQGITPNAVKECKAYLLQAKRHKPATDDRKLALISAFCEWTRTEDEKDRPTRDAGERLEEQGDNLE